MEYTCVNCNNKIDREFNPNIITYPECPECHNIMSNKVVESEVADKVRSLFKEYYGISVLIAPINNGKRMKFRWFNGPAAQTIMANDEFINELKSIRVDGHGIMGKRAFKRYITQDIFDEYRNRLDKYMPEQTLRNCVIPLLAETDLEVI